MNPTAKGLAASGILLGLMALAWFSMEADKIRTVVLIVLGLFLFRVVLHSLRSRYDK